MGGSNRANEVSPSFYLIHTVHTPAMIFMQGTDDDPDANGNGNGHGEDGEETSKKRVTLLVNVWLNHLPNSAERPGA